MQRPVASRVPATLAREIAVREGVPLVIEGRIQQVGNTYLVRAALVSPLDGAEQSAVQETAASEDALIAAIGRLARRTREKLGESSTTLTALAPMERVTTTSLDALRKYSEAVRFGESIREKDAGKREIELLEDAVRLDSTFAMAWRRLGVRLLSGDPRLSNERLVRGRLALTHAYELRERLSPVERGLAEAAYFTEVARDPARATAAYEAILDEQPANRIALNNLANVALVDGKFERVREYGRRYVTVDSSNLAAWAWVLWGAYGTGRVDEAHAARALMRKRFASLEQLAELNAQDLHWLAVERDWPSLERLARGLMQQAREARQEDRALRSLMLSLTMRGKFEAAWRANDSVGARRLVGRDTAELRLWRGDGARQRYFDRALYLGDTVGVRRAIQTYRAVSGVDRWLMKDRPNWNLVLDHVVAGDAKAARAQFDAYRAASAREKGAGALAPVGSAFMQSIEGLVLVAEARAREALRVLAPVMADAARVPTPETYTVGRAWLAAGERDSARVWLTRVTGTQDPRRAWTEGMYRAPALQLLCGIADTELQRQESCGAIVREWQDADDIAQPIVTRARARLRS